MEVQKSQKGANDIIMKRKIYQQLLLSAKHDLPMPNLFITSGWAYLCFMTSPLIRFPYRQEVLQMPVQA